MAYLTPNWIPLKRVCKFPNVLRVYKRAGRGQGSGQGTVPPFQQTLTGFATAAGTTGQVSFTASTYPVQVGQEVTLSGVLGGTGTISGYTNPTTYLVGVTNGSTTATLTTLAGGVVTTTAGTISGITVVAGTTPVGTLLSAVKGFLMTVKIAVQGESLPGTGNPSPPALPAWIRKDPGSAPSDWQSVQIDVTNIPGVRPLRKDGRWVGTPY
jgi:hypothetical protein